ncbi:hypothetical protein CLOSTMETH_01048 [[Clostridium] methylpentosum DSM 5476]|uniref:Uncharacterized protein n=1 Tax=[Clostridium] methylpentosum DSM 5476 TaxID=537013 RepID=C0EB30_9FIRM|nr:hypothetical protein CLOSTMETH_01048 [[Clostridium] methylpentosum DSM 5476]
MLSPPQNHFYSKCWRASENYTGCNRKLVNIPLKTWWKELKRIWNKLKTRLKELKGSMISCLTIFLPC